MAIRVKLRLRTGDREVIVSALVNSGFESEELDVAIPVRLAKELGLWPPREFSLEEVRTAGGSVEVYVVPNALKVSLHEVGGREVTCNAVIDPHLDEVALCDRMIDELGIVAVSFGRGLWRHVSDKPETVRKSASREEWSTCFQA